MWALCLWIFLQSCHHVESDFQFDENPYADLVTILNSNIQGIQELVVRNMNNEAIAYVDSFNAGRVILYFMDESTPVSIVSKIGDGVVRYPSLAVAPYGDRLCWTLSGDFLTTTGGSKIDVSDRTSTPSLQYSGGQWYCRIGDYMSAIAPEDLSTDVPSVHFVEDGYVSISFPTDYQLLMPVMDFQYPYVPNRAFYKDVFLDAGIGLTSRKSLYAASYLKLSLEGISFSRSLTLPDEKEMQEMIVGGDDEDTNGRLLYPDGQPRYKLLFVNGGDSRMHGKSLGDVALKNMQRFVSNGGSYVGTCAGAFFASNGYDSHSDYPYYLKAWPGITVHTGISNSSTGMFIEKDSPLLNYYDFGGDYYVEDIRHNKGGYPSGLPSYTEVLARYDCPSKSTVHLQPSAWAYKADSRVGRVVLIGSHPEEVGSGERRDFTAAMIRYAIDGQGNTVLKGFLQNGAERVMDKSTEDGDPYFTKIGDLQCHHFVVSIPPDAQNIVVRLDGYMDCDMALMMRQGTFAYPDSADYYVADGGPHQELGFQTLESGLWYIAVQNLTTVEIEQTEYGQSYKGRTDVLNGVPYSVCVTWE